ncbi:MAG: hypothetical protein LC102_12775 [Ignavibacteriales bacterium]|nr:MAG: hypothetical protein F9K26_00370 [Ignavibacteriaceae bacterium]MBW7871864.1 hypothetical protein [Ignavibacteria bacterium]MBZ0197291.1 hypothetical protein [Ignavibacteriaceae bacterium]MCZ2144286.1 hypothetical protein [Ignavibacteriales bacterium]WKZ73044.1 MAG: hypothetical protein QY308_02295 [Ignavibacteriaceae bacterium]
MKLILPIVIVLAVSVLAGAFLDFFYAKSEDGQVKVEWKTTTENNIKSFVIERRTHNTAFTEIGRLSPKGNNSYYVFYDEGAYKTTDVVYIYRLKIFDKDNTSSYSREVSVSHSVSGLKKTWGSIKAMFR